MMMHSYITKLLSPYMYIFPKLNRNIHTNKYMVIKWLNEKKSSSNVITCIYIYTAKIIHSHFDRSTLIF